MGIPEPQNVERTTDTDPRAFFVFQVLPEGFKTKTKINQKMKRIFLLFLYVCLVCVRGMCFYPGETVSFCDEEENYVFEWVYGDETCNFLGIINPDIKAADVPSSFVINGYHISVSSFRKVGSNHELYDYFKEISSNVISVKIPDTVEYIDDNFFFDYVNLVRIEVGSGVRYFGKNTNTRKDTNAKMFWYGKEPPYYFGGWGVAYVPNDSYNTYTNNSRTYVYSRINEKFEVDGLIYIPKDDDNTCDLVDCDYLKENQNLVIKNIVSYEGEDYKVENLRECACNGNNNIKNITIEYNGDLPDHIFYGCTALESITIPPSIRNVGLSAFALCKGLKTLELLNCGEVDRHAFSSCDALKSVVIGASVTRLGSYVFPACLQNITCYNSSPTDVDSDALRDVNKEFCILHVPVGSSQRYKTYREWKDFKNIVEDGIPAGIEDVSSLEENEDKAIVGYYDQVGRHYNEAQRGLNIVVYSDGSTKKFIHK